MRSSSKLTVGLAIFVTLTVVDSALAYYSPRLGRFISRDPIGEREAVPARQPLAPAAFVPRDPIGERAGPNPYRAVNNAPMDWCDPDGAAPRALFTLLDVSTQPSSGPSATQPANTCVVELWCSAIGPFSHCEWVIAQSQGKTGLCTCGPQACPSVWTYKICCFGCLGCTWQDLDRPGGSGTVVARKSLPESACTCVRDKCRGWKPTSCYGIAIDNSNTGAGCLSRACDLHVTIFDVPFGAVGWHGGEGEGDCPGMP